MVLLEALAAIGALALAYGMACTICYLKMSPWSARDRDHSLEVAALPYPLYAFGCWSRALGRWLYNLIPAPMLAVELSSRFLQSQVLFTVVQLGIPDVICRLGQPATASQLAAECGCPNVDWLDRLLRAAAVLDILTARRSKSSAAISLGAIKHTADVPAVNDVFSAADEYVFGLNSVSACLCKHHTSSVQAMVKLYAYNYATSTALTQSLQTGRVAHELQTGQGFWDHLTSDPEKGAVFDEAMSCFKDLGGASVVSCRIWRELGAVVDVAGGNGSFVASLLVGHPHLTGTVMDQKDQVARGEEWWQQHYPELQSRVAFKAGDMFADIPRPPPGRQQAAYILRNILHNWADPQALQILRCIRAAITPEDAARVKLVIIELTSSTGGMPPLLEPRVMADIQMLVLFGSGKERSERQMAALLAAAGFRLARVVPTTGLLLLLEAEPV